MASQYPPITASGRIIGKSATTGTCVALPGGLNGHSGSVVVVATGNAAYGAWTEVSASTAAEYVITHVLLQSAIPIGWWTIRLGIGGAGSEVQAAQTLVYASGSGTSGNIVPFACPPRVAAGSRVSLSAAGLSVESINMALLAATYSAIEGS